MTFATSPLVGASFNRRTITLKQGRIISDVPASFGEEVHV